MRYLHPHPKHDARQFRPVAFTQDIPCLPRHQDTRPVEGLPVLDNLALARQAGTRQGADAAPLEGIELVERQFLGSRGIALLGARSSGGLNGSERLSSTANPPSN